MGPQQTVSVQPATDQSLMDVLEATLTYARSRDYMGPDYADGLSSAIRRVIPIESKWLNLLFQETIKRAPINIRPYLLVEYRRNYKGIALFSLANLNAHRLQAVTGQLNDDVDFLRESVSLADWLITNRSQGYSGFCGGYQHPVQFLTAKGEPNDPDIVATSYATKALLSLADQDETYPDIAKTAEGFLVEDLQYREVETGAKIDYHFNHPEDAYTLNAAALGARMLIDLHAYSGDEPLRDHAKHILDHVASKQTPMGGWYYRDPPDASHLSMDSHHNGFIIEAFQRYAAVTGSDRYDATLTDALEFYRSHLFEANGAPNFDEQNAYPRDIHASSQGILVFTYAGDFEMAARIIHWTLGHLAADEGRFYFRKHRHHTKRVTLMRWCQAWMAYSLSEFLAARVEGVPPASQGLPI